MLATEFASLAIVWVVHAALAASIFIHRTSFACTFLTKTHLIQSYSVHARPIMSPMISLDTDAV